jgi:hypothetical protein
MKRAGKRALHAAGRLGKGRRVCAALSDAAILNLRPPPPGGASEREVRAINYVAQKNGARTKKELALENKSCTIWLY